MTKEQIKNKLLEATMKFIQAERNYDEMDDDAAEHMMIENEKWLAREEMDTLYDALLKMK